MASHRVTASMAAWLGAAAGAWLIVAVPLATGVLDLDIGAPDPAASDAVQALEVLFYFTAIGAAILAVSCVAIGRLAVRSEREVRVVERSAARRAERAEAERREAERVEAERREAERAEAERGQAGAGWGPAGQQPGGQQPAPQQPGTEQPAPQQPTAQQPAAPQQPTAQQPVAPQQPVEHGPGPAQAGPRLR
jgi:hypothetical protein